MRTYQPQPGDFEPATADIHVETLSRPSLSYWQDAWLRLKKNPRAIVSLYIVVALAAFTLLGLHAAWPSRCSAKTAACPNRGFGSDWSSYGSKWGFDVSKLRVGADPGVVLAQHGQPCIKILGGLGKGRLDCWKQIGLF